MRRLSATLLVLGGVFLSGCFEQAKTETPGPQEFTSEDAGQICGMLLSDHAGPKGQIHIPVQQQPMWFTTVRDTLAYLRMPDSANQISVAYVSDMGKAQSWAVPGPGAWVKLQDAFFVIDSERQGGMGAPEAIPFSQRKDAETFVLEHGGVIVRHHDIPHAYLFELPHGSEVSEGDPAAHHG